MISVSLLHHHPLWAETVDAYVRLHVPLSQGLV
jgi:hypothetical protein